MTAGRQVGDMLVIDSFERDTLLGFASPTAAPLAHAGDSAATRAAEPVQPAARPDEVTAAPGPALDSLASETGGTRDPRQPFDDVQQLITRPGSAPDPRAPIRVMSSTDLVSGTDAPHTLASQPHPEVTDDPLGAPPRGMPVVPRPARIGLGEVLKAIGRPMLIVLLAGSVLSPLSLIALVIAWMLSMLNPQTSAALRKVYLGAVGVLVLVVLGALLMEYYDPLSLANGWARWVCLALLVACPVAMRRWILQGRLHRDAPDARGGTPEDDQGSRPPRRG